MAKNEALKTFNKLMVYVVIFLSVFAIAGFFVFRSDAGKQSINAYAIDGAGPRARESSWTCIFTPDGCSSGGGAGRTCTDECTPGAYCYGGNTYTLCNKNYDRDPCYEWSNVRSCPGGQVCQVNNGVTQCVAQEQNNAPDLEVSYANAYRSFNSININVYIRNIGNMNASSSIARVVGFPNGGIRYINTPIVASGATTQISTSYPLSANASWFNITADFFNNVSESNEMNNKYGFRNLSMGP